MSYKFIPQSCLLNNIYIPLYEKPRKNILDLESFSIQTDINGVESIIDLNSADEKYYPFIDISKYDSEREDWYYYDTNGFPYRLTYNSTGYWDVEAVWEIPSINANTSDLSISLFMQKEITCELGVYTQVTKSDNSTLNLYKGQPIVVAVNDIPLKDLTDYTNPSTKPILNNINPSVEKEFYYDFDRNLIITNQNLNGTNKKSVTIGFYTTIKETNVQYTLHANQPNPSITPIVKWYILKLSGQDLRG